VHLGLERVAHAIVIEVLEERVLLDLFEYQSRLEPLAQQPGEAGLPYPDHALDHDVSILRHARAPGNGRAIVSRTLESPAGIFIGWAAFGS
jgi:hypothetical protein